MITTEKDTYDTATDHLQETWQFFPFSQHIGFQIHSQPQPFYHNSSDSHSQTLIGIHIVDAILGTKKKLAGWMFGRAAICWRRMGPCSHYGRPAGRPMAGHGKPKKYHWVATRHGAEQYTGYLEFVFYGYHLDRAIPRISEAVYCLTPSLVATHDDTSDCMYHVWGTFPAQMWWKNERDTIHCQKPL